MNQNILPQVLVAQLGARMHYAVPVILNKASMLAHCYTDIYAGQGSRINFLANMAEKIIPPSRRPNVLNSFLDRQSLDLPGAKIKAFNLFGLRYAIALKQSSSVEDTERVNICYGKKFCHRVVSCGFHHSQAVYTFEGASREIMIAAKQHGLINIYEKFIAPQKIGYRILAEEHNYWPDWESPTPPENIYIPRYTIEREERELADLILCPSDFVLTEMRKMGVKSAKLHLVPYGVDIQAFANSRQPWDGRRPLRILFLGGVNLRKGVQYIYQALERLDSSRLEVRMVGGIALKEYYRRRLADRVNLTGPVARSKVRQHYQWADLFVFPSLCEGSATVTYEALAAGLPIITTPNAGSVIRDGIDGFIVPIRDSDALAEKIELLANNAELLAYFSTNASEWAKEYSLEKYGARLAKCISEFIQIDYD